MLLEAKVVCTELMPGPVGDRLKQFTLSCNTVGCILYLHKRR